MKNIVKLGTIAVAFTLALSAFALAAPKADRAKQYFYISGAVLGIDTQQRTLLIGDQISGKRYVVEVPEGATFKITFGRYMQLSEAGFDDVIAGERVKIRCERATDRLAQLDDGRYAIRLIAAR